MRPSPTLSRSLALLTLVALRGLTAAAIGGEPPPTVSASSIVELGTQIEAYVNAARFHPALWGIKVVSLDSGRTWFEHHADRLMSPASNCKLYVAALALDRLGAEYRITTPILADARPDEDGTINGDLVVSGRGDPSWKSRGSDRTFEAIFEPFVAAIERAGVRHVRGDIVADATFFRGPPNGAGWTADDLDDYYGAEISAISLEDNYAVLAVKPAAESGQPCQLTLVHPHTGLLLDNRTATAGAGTSVRVVTRRIFGEPMVHVFGGLSVGTEPELLDVTVPRPAQWFAAGLREALIKRGIHVDGQPRSVRWPEPPLASAAWIVLAEITSAPLSELVASLVKASQNLETDLLFAHVGERFRAADTPPWRTSEQLALTALGDFLREHELPAEEVQFDEGSGLSRNNLASANATVALLRFMAAHRAAKAYADALPVAGRDGTLRRRMKGTAGENNIRAKTGTLRWASSLSGYVTTAAHERLAFSLMLNRAVMPPGMNARTDLDAIALTLASFHGSDAPRGGTREAGR